MVNLITILVPEIIIQLGELKVRHPPLENHFRLIV